MFTANEEVGRLGAERLHAFEAVGVKTFLLQFHPLVKELERFGQYVMPLLL